MRKLFLIGALVLFINGTVNAKQNGFYIGGGGGQSKAVNQCGATLSCDKEDGGFKTFIGINPSQHFNLELSYVDLGEINGSFISSTGVPLSFSFEADGISLSGIGLIPVKKDMFFLTGKAGLFRWDVTRKNSIQGASLLSQDDSGTDLIYGIGAMGKFDNRFGIRVEWEKYTSLGKFFTTGTDDMEFLSFSGMVFF